MVSFLQRNIVLSALLLFATLAISFLFKGSYLALFLPFLVGFAYMVLFRQDLLLYSLAFLVPISINFENLPLGFGLILPTEPILIVIMITVGAKLLWIEKKLLLHPISLIIFIHLLWMLLSSAFSSMPFVSIKFFIARCWFVISFYYLALNLFQKEFSIKRYLVFYVIGLTMVIFYIVYEHYQKDFANSAVYYMTQPFFKDHTSYGAVLAMLLPFIYFYFKNTKIHFNKVLLFFTLIIISIATVLSYTRAAWISLIAAIAFYFIIKFKIRIKIIVMGVLAGTLLLLAFNYQIQGFLNKNNQDASGNFTEHLNSIYNIKTDASNVERINRWTSAIEMFKEKPFLGFGPGTYAFKYAPYQSAKYKTIISTNFGDVGNAHSEYLGPLAEMGLIGALLFIGLVIAVIFYGVQNHNSSNISENNRWLNLSALLGLVTYFVHGFLNNYLDTDKASALFWVFIAFITSINYQLKNNPSLSSDKTGLIKR